MAGGAVQDPDRVQAEVTDVLGLSLQANKTKRHGKKDFALPQKWGSVAGRDALQQRQELNADSPTVSALAAADLETISNPNSSTFCATSCKHSFQKSCSPSPRALCV